jgi:hypothetical protein
MLRKNHPTKTKYKDLFPSAFAQICLLVAVSKTIGGKEILEGAVDYYQCRDEDVLDGPGRSRLQVDL